jgi:CheY-like chemotaxis protein
MIELHFEAKQACFLGQPAGSEATLTFAPQGLTKADLMGELSQLLALPAYKLALSVPYEAWRQLEYIHLLLVRLCETLGGTTYRDSTLDYQLHHMNEIEVYDQLRARPELAEIPALLMTAGLGMPRHALENRKMIGLSKPLELSPFLETLDKLPEQKTGQ